MNRLSKEKSPYLLQHANNPVDWFPWGEEAFERARKENKPIFLSIGYSTCHWCHVMERESFEDEETARLMNEQFINIKLDREERPDVDKVYMSAVQTMTGHGGWPLSVFLTPDLKPFYGGTYFPPKDGYGRPGFPTLLTRISEVWRTENDNVIHSAEQLTKELQHHHSIDSASTAIDESILNRTYHQLAAGYDPAFAGFGSGTKFPRPAVLNFLFRYHYRTKNEDALRMSLNTLLAMANGGMHDHLGGGFHRYSVDSQWRVPHFEKMLYDQAQLVQSYLDAYQITGDETFASVARATLDYVLRDVRSPLGGFYSAEDADSTDPHDPAHAKEGAFYLWEKSEIDRIVTPSESAVFCHYYSINEHGNALNDPHSEFINKNIPFSAFTLEETAAVARVSVEEATRLLESARRSLFAERLQRPRPHLDDKVLTSWNGLMIGAFARASVVLSDQRYRTAAEQAAEFILSRMMEPETKTLFRRFRDGEVKFEAHLDDYAFFVSGLLDLYEATFDVRWIEQANELTGRMITLFWDSAEGGFYDTSGKDRSVLVRTKEAYDGAEPTGNSIAVMNLLRLYHLIATPSYRAYAEKSIKYFCTLLAPSPQIMPQMMSAVEYFRTTAEHLVIVPGDTDENFSVPGQLSKRFAPVRTCILLSRQSRQFFSDYAAYTRDMSTVNNITTYYYCSDFTCEKPVNNIDDIIEK